MPGPTNYRSDLARQTAQLLEQARALDAQQKSDSANVPSSTEQELNADPTRITREAPAHRLAEQYSKNIAALNQGEQIFSRRQENPSKQVVKSSESSLKRDRAPERRPKGVAGRPSKPTRPLNEEASGNPEEPMHVTQPRAYEEAITTNEEFIASLEEAPAAATTRAPDTDSTLPASDQVGPELFGIIEHLLEPAPVDEDRFVPEAPVHEEPQPQSTSPDVTNTNFVYTKEDSPFYKLAEGAIIESGEGKPVADRGRTQTQVAVPNNSEATETTSTVKLSSVTDE